MMTRTAGWRNRFVAGGALFAWAVFPEAIALAQSATVLDETAYCRSYIEFGIDRIDPGLLRAEGEKVLDERGLARLKRSVQQRFAHKDKAWDENAWMEDAMVNFVGLQYGDRSAADMLIYVPLPPAGWMKPEFDDSSWLRQRLPLMVSKAGPGSLRLAGAVNGVFSAQSGIMGPTDGFRLLVVDGLDNAAEMRLVVRPDQLPGYPLNVFWFDPAFYK